MAKTPTKWTWGTGRRKTAVARVRLADGSGKIEVNGRPLDQFFTEDKHLADIQAPLQATSSAGRFDIFVNVRGGGFSGQAGATMLGVARALRNLDKANYPALREGGFLTRDSRMKERKKYGQKGARKRFQFSKR